MCGAASASLCGSLPRCCLSSFSSAGLPRHWFWCQCHHRRHQSRSASAGSMTQRAPQQSTVQHERPLTDHPRRACDHLQLLRRHWSQGHRFTAGIPPLIHHHCRARRNMQPRTAWSRRVTMRRGLALIWTPLRAAAYSHCASPTARARATRPERPSLTLDGPRTTGRPRARPAAL